MMKMLQCKGVYLEKRGAGGKKKVLLGNINAEFTAGEMIVVGGETGAGKSTLIHVLAGLIRPTRGEVAADDEKVSRWVSMHRDLWRRKVGVIFQRPHLAPGLTVLENVCVPLVPKKMTLSEARKRARRALDRMAVGHLAGEFISKLSGGELQRAACARAIASSPELILADEPTAHQDSKNAGIIMHVFHEFKKNKGIVILASHDPRILIRKDFDARFQMKNGSLRKLEPCS